MEGLTLSAGNFCTSERNGLVSIGSHHLFVHTAGPDRKSSEPVVVIIQGVGSSIKGWVAVYRLLKPFVRVVLYDRSGYGQSDVSPEKPASSTIAAELDRLLQNANIAPPYILVGHSWGGILSREFFSLRPDAVVGMVFVDANQEHQLEVHDWRKPSIWAIAGPMDFFEDTGLNKEHKLTDEEWRAYVEDETSPKHKEQAAKELAEYEKSFPLLASKLQLHRTPPFMGDRPLSIIMCCGGRDFERLYEAGVKAGHGSEKERAVFLEYLRKVDENHYNLQTETLSLSNNTRFLSATDSGHYVNLTQPELIVDEVKWVLDQCR